MIANYKRKIHTDTKYNEQLYKIDKIFRQTVLNESSEGNRYRKRQIKSTNNCNGKTNTVQVQETKTKREQNKCQCKSYVIKATSTRRWNIDRYEEKGRDKEATVYKEENVLTTI